MVLEVAFALALGQVAASPSVAGDLEGIEHRIAASSNASDCAAWGAMVAPEWSVIHVDGTVMERREALELCEGPLPPDQELAVDELSVRAFGDEAVVTGRTRVTAGGGSSTTLTLRFTDVFIHRCGRRQVVASHATRLPS
jgi:hypothetical protein